MKNLKKKSPNDLEELWFERDFEKFLFIAIRSNKKVHFYPIASEFVGNLKVNRLYGL
jgi:hypothetical protein